MEKEYDRERLEGFLENSQFWIQPAFEVDASEIFFFDSC